MHSIVKNNSSIYSCSIPTHPSTLVAVSLHLSPRDALAIPLLLLCGSLYRELPSRELHLYESMLGFVCTSFTIRNRGHIS